MKQKICGVVFLILCAGIITLAASGSTADERDVSPVLLLGPCGIYLIFTRKNYMYDFGELEKAAGEVAASTSGTDK